jgi:lyso-ornithine lipid O-acyltransferase
VSLLAGILKSLLIWGQVATYILYSMAGRLLLRGRGRRLRFHAGTTHRGAIFTLWYLGVRLTVKGRENIPADRKVLLVSNHTGYVDILAISSVLPALYITSMDVKRTFFLGLMAELGGSLFVDRRSKSRLLEEIAQIGDTIGTGNAVVLFPEGTSSNGEGVLPFKMALFAVAEREGFAVTPLCIRYTKVNGRPVSPANRDRVFYYGGIRFLPHILQLPFLRSVEVTLEFLPALTPAQRASRKEMAESCYTMIAGAHARNAA